MADQATIKQHWRAALFRVHPDQGGTADQTIEVQTAYETLSDAGQRAAYDDELRRDANTATGASEGFVDDLAHAMAEAMAEMFARAVAEAMAETMAAAYRAYATAQSADPSVPHDDVADPKRWTQRIREDAGDIFCSATTRKGYPCLGQRFQGGLHCWQHAKQAKDGTLSTAPSPTVSRCSSRTKKGLPCGGIAFEDGLCYQHGGGAARAARSPSASSGIPGSPSRVGPSSPSKSKSRVGSVKETNSPHADLSGVGSFVGCLGISGLVALAGSWLALSVIDPDALKYGGTIIRNVLVGSLILMVAGIVLSGSGPKRS